jgi:hypothetical protein
LFSRRSSGVLSFVCEKDERGRFDCRASLYYTNSDQKELIGPDANWLSDGITESLINDLSHVPNLKVIARSSVFRYKGQNVDPQTDRARA